MGNSMNHLESSTFSLFFIITILTICILLVSHIVWTLWQKRNQLQHLKEKHSTIVHSLPMSLGMISSMTICTGVGAALHNHLNVAYIVGFLIGIFVSVIISFSFKDDLALLDGMGAGEMGGLMGVMIGTMITQIGLYVVVILMTLLFIMTWMVMYRRINRQIENGENPAEAKFSELNHQQLPEQNLSKSEWQEVLNQKVLALMEDEHEKMHMKFSEQMNEVIKRTVRQVIEEKESKMSGS